MRIRLGVVMAVVMGLMLLAVGQVSAACVANRTGFGTLPPGGNGFNIDSCWVDSGIEGSRGITWYGCGSYEIENVTVPCQDANEQPKDCPAYEYRCYYNEYYCIDSNNCAGMPSGGGTGGIACTRHWDCATGCCQGGYCSSSCTPPPARCNEGETFVAFGPPPQTSCASPGACEMGSDGVTGGYAGEVLWDETCGPNESKNMCLLGSCVPNAPSCKATAPAITKIEPGADPATQAVLTWLNGRDGGTSTPDESVVIDVYKNQLSYVTLRERFLRPKSLAFERRDPSLRSG